MRVKDMFPHLAYGRLYGLGAAEVVGYSVLRVHDVKRTDTLSSPVRSRELMFQDFAVILRVDGRLRAFIGGWEFPVLRVFEYICAARFERLVPEKERLMRELALEAM